MEVDFKRQLSLVRCRFSTAIMAQATMNVPQFSASGAVTGVIASMQTLSVHGIYTILECA